MVPSEKFLYDRLSGLTGPSRSRLVEEVSKISAKRKFFYQNKDNHPVGLVPLVLNKTLVPSFESVTRVLFKFQNLAPKLYLSNHRRFADLIQLERRTKTWIERTGNRPNRPWEHLNRPDYGMKVVDGRLVPVVFELNSLMLGGMYIQSVSLALAKECVLPRLGADTRRLGLKPSMDLLPFLKRWLLEARRLGGPGAGGIAFLEQLPPGGGFSELPQITDYFRAAGVEARHGDPRNLELRKDGVYLKGMKVAYAYRDFSYEDVGGPENPRLKAFRRLWDEGRVTPGFPADFDQKGILECLTSEEFSDLFTRAEARLLAAHVPWTRVLTGRKTTSMEGREVDLPEYARKRRESLVIKPSWGAGGEGVLLGRKVKEARWEKAVAAAVARPGAYALQAYVDAPPRPSAYLRGGEVQMRPCRCTIGMFHDGKAFGYHFRVSPKDIVNVAQGGALGPVYFG